MGKNVHATGEGNSSPLMISIISTGALPVNTRGSRSTDEAEGSELGRRGRSPKGARANASANANAGESVHSKASFLRSD